MKTNLKPRKILLVDSETSASAELASHLARDKREVEITVAAGPSDAMRLLASNSDFDLAVVELDLPARSALSALPELKQELPDRTPVLMFADWGDEDMWVDAINAGANGFVARPDLAPEVAKHVRDVA